MADVKISAFPATTRPVEAALLPIVQDGANYTVDPFNLLWWTCPERFAENTTPGTTDMTAAIQAALDSGAKEVRLKDTTYLISASLEYPSGVTLRGSGIYTQHGYGSLDDTESDLTAIVAAQQTVIKLAADCPENTVMLTPASPSDTHGFRLESLCLYGNKYNNLGKTAQHGISIPNGTGANISGTYINQVLILGCAGHGFINGNTQREIVIENCVALANRGTGWVITSQDMVLRKIGSGFNEIDGIEITGPGNNRIFLIDSYYNKRFGLYAHNMNTLRGIHVQINVNGQAGLELQEIWDVRITDFHVYGNGQATDNAYADVRVGAGAYDVEFVSAKFGQHFDYTSDWPEGYSTIYTNNAAYAIVNESTRKDTVSVIGGMFHSRCYGSGKVYDTEPAETDRVGNYGYTRLIGCRYMTADTPSDTYAINQDNFTYITDSHTLKPWENKVLVGLSEDATITLPFVADLRVGHTFRIQKFNAEHTLTIDGAGTDPINGVASISLRNKGSWADITHAGLGWTASYGSHSEMPYVTPEQFGAVGDGVVDDSAAISAAISACPAGGTVKFGPKTYKCNSLLAQINKPMTLEGCLGMPDIVTGATVLDFSGVGDGTSGAGIEILRDATYSASGTIIRNLQIRNTGTYAAKYSGIWMHGSGNIATITSVSSTSGTFVIGSTVTWDSAASSGIVQAINGSGMPTKILITAGTMTTSDVVTDGSASCTIGGVTIAPVWLVQCVVENVKIVGWLTGVTQNYCYMNTFRNVVAAFARKDADGNFGHGFYSIHGATSTVYDRCWAQNNANHGYYINGAYYHTFISCSADNNGKFDATEANGLTEDAIAHAYMFEGCNGFAMTGCGAENNTGLALFQNGGTVVVDGLLCHVNAKLCDTLAGTPASTAIVTNDGNLTLNNVKELSINTSFTGLYSAVVSFGSTLYTNNCRWQLQVYRSSSTSLYGDGVVWVAGDTPTRTGATTFTVTGDKTAKYPIGTLLRILLSAGQKMWSSVASVEYTSVTTITCTSGFATMLSFEYAPYYNRVRYLGNNRQSYGSTYPTENTVWYAGDIVWNTNAEGNRGWRCISTGTPGTWQALNVFGGASNYSSFEADGTLVFTGDATVYQDIDAAIIPKATGVGNPTLGTFTTNTQAWKFALNDTCHIDARELQHYWKEGSQIEFHVHWATNGANDATVRSVKWEIYMAWANAEPAGGTVVFAETAITQATATTIANAEASLTHKYSSVGTYTPTGGKIGGYLVVTLKRIAGGGTEPANDPFVLGCGVHVQCDTVGSRATAAK